MDFLLRGVAAFLALGCEITVFFLLMRLLTQRVPLKVLQAFDSAGRELVDGTLSLFDRFIKPRTGRLREGVKILLSMLGLVFLEVLLRALL